MNLQDRIDELEVRLAFQKALTVLLARSAANLAIFARTSGGTAGRDEGLVAACERVEQSIRIVEAGQSTSEHSVERKEK